jgi:hypothetical protein
MTLKEKLIELDACKPAREWVGDMDFATAWETCERGDWMLWLIKEGNLCDLRTFTLAKAKCAETVKHLMRDKRSLDALQAAFDFAEGKINEKQLAEAAEAAWAAAAAEAAAWAAAAEAAWAAAAEAAWAAGSEAAWAAGSEAAEARKNNLKLCATLIREVLPKPTFV